MFSRSYIWRRPNEKVKFSGFTPAEIAVLAPALKQTDTYLRNDRKLNAEFVKRAPTLFNKNRVAAETHYHMFGGKATVKVNPDIFQRNRYGWDPSGVVAHEIGHLIGPTRNTTSKERQDFQRAFSYRQKKIYHALAPQVWSMRRDSPLRGQRTRQAVDAGEAFAETWRTITGQPFTNRTNQEYFATVVTPSMYGHMKENYLR